MMAFKRVAFTACVGAAMLVSCAAPQSDGDAPLAASSEGCADTIAYNQTHYGVALLVLRDGEVVCEAYAEDFSPERPYTTFSGSKSYVGVVAAAAVADGLLTLNEPVAETITEWRDDPLRSGITIRDLLSLTSGLDTRGPRWAPPFEEALSLPAAVEPGSEFRYGPIVFQIFGAVMDRKLAAAGRPERFADYLDDRVLRPAGVEAPEWLAAGDPPIAVFRSGTLPDPLPDLGDADPNLAAGAIASAQGWAAFGEFVRTWPKQQQVELDAGAFAAQFDGTATNPGYGLGWWLARPMDLTRKDELGRVMSEVDLVDGATNGAIPDDVAAALGAAGQMLFVIPSEGVVAVRFGAPPRGSGRTATGSAGFSQTEFVQLVLSIE